ncbi:hypothetical protein DSO57_1020603 [Entomophthora muscae]|uniref:Uncharacterized protein n=1 Tax=Entomophthora muscae TaxID=34485 RepID=A0ACC2UPF9_9FUNG|nr:hypothetical protein DSO57_1020603 [Entomophthora muscae]
MGIDKFFGKNKENIINWLDHSAFKLCAFCISHKKWVQEASKRLYKAAANWFATWVSSQTDNQLNNWEEFKADITHNFHVTESLQDISTSMGWWAGCQKNKAELHPLCPFTASCLGTRPGILAKTFFVY